MATLKRQAAIQREGRLKLALQAYRRGEFQTYTAAAISLLHAQYYTPSPQLRPQAQPAWTAETPHDIVELEH